MQNSFFTNIFDKKSKYLLNKSKKNCYFVDKYHIIVAKSGMKWYYMVTSGKFGRDYYAWWRISAYDR